MRLVDGHVHDLGTTLTAGQGRPKRHLAHLSTVINANKRRSRFSGLRCLFEIDCAQADAASPSRTKNKASGRVCTAGRRAMVSMRDFVLGTHGDDRPTQPGNPG